MHGYDEQQLFGDDKLRVEVRFSMYHGWEWRVVYWDGFHHEAVDSGLERSAADAVICSAEALTEFAHTLY